MKKNWRLAVILAINLIAINLILTACSSIEIKNSEDSNDKKTEKVEDYIPFKADTLYEYKGIGDEFAEQKAYVEYLSDNRAQLKIFNPGMDLIKVLEYKDGEIHEVFSEGEFPHIENKIEAEARETSVILKGPIQVGTSWYISKGRKRSITGIDKEIDLPYGKLEALEVRTELEDKRYQLDYYVKALGHVASIYKDGDFEVKTLLKKIHKGPISYDIKAFYPLDDGGGIVYKDRSISFKTNDSIEKLVEENMKNPDNQTLVPLLTDGATINFISLDQANNILNIDFNKSFLDSNREKDIGLEGEIVQAIVNTMGDMYDTNKVYISIEGKPYQSNSLMLEEGKYFETTEDAIKIVD